MTIKLEKDGESPGKPKSKETLASEGSNMQPEADLRDLFLDEAMLIEIAKKELKGRLPPGFLESNHSNDLTAGIYKSNKKFSGGSPCRTLLAAEMDSRGWTALDVSSKTKIPVGEVQAIYRGSARISESTAEIFAKLFATSKELWLGK